MLTEINRKKLGKREKKSTGSVLQFGESRHSKEGNREMPTSTQVYITAVVTYTYACVHTHTHTYIYMKKIQSKQAIQF